jgi:acyl-CoA synthetase (AMP-forming)/AMP-acid ligase II
MYMVSEATTQSETFVDLLAEQARLYGDKTAYAFLEDGENVTDTVSFAQMLERARAVAVELSRRAPVGSRVLLLYPSCIDYMVGFFGCLSAGMIAVPIFPPNSGRHNPRLEAVSRDCGAFLGLTTTRQLQVMQPALLASPLLSALDMICTDQIPHSAPGWRRPDIETATLAMLQYTSGSTGKPKGVMVSHGNLLGNERMIQAAIGSSCNSVYVSWLPLFHDMGLIGCMLHAYWLGATCYFMAPASFLKRPTRWVQAISRYRGTLSGGPNFAYELCAEKVQAEPGLDLDLSCWTMAFSGSEPVRYSTLERFSEVHARYGFVPSSWLPSYGMAEATLVVTCANGGDPRQPPVVRRLDKAMLGARRVVPAGSGEGVSVVGCGKPLPEQTIRIVDPVTCELCPPDRIGEIWLAGPHIAHGYWQRPEESRDTFQAHIVGSGEGPFLRTGDLGFLCDGQMVVAGRIKDMMIVRGVNYYPQDIEACVEAAADELQSSGAAAFSLDAGAGERVVVVAEVKRSAMRSLDRRRVIGRVRERVLDQHELALADLVLIRQGSLPKTSSGKVQRNQVRQLYLARQLVTLDAAELVEA